MPVTSDESLKFQSPELTFRAITSSLGMGFTDVAGADVDALGADMVLMVLFGRVVGVVHPLVAAESCQGYLPGRDGTYFKCTL